MASISLSENEKIGFILTQFEAFTHSSGVLVHEVERFAIFGVGCPWSFR